MGSWRQMGHAGIIVGGADDTAAAKIAIMRECGIHVVDSPAEIGDTMLKVLGAKQLLLFSKKAPAQTGAFSVNPINVCASSGLA
jgi:hypothetical protein